MGLRGRNQPALLPPPPSPFRPADWARAVLEPFVPADPVALTWVDVVRLPVTLVSAAVLLVLVTRPPRGDEGEEEARSARRVTRWARRLLYALSVVNPFFSVLADDFTFVRDAASSYVVKSRSWKQRRKGGVLPEQQEEALRQLAFGIGKIRPRRLFAAGSMLRGLQLYSPLEQLFDPPSHFGSVVNALALVDGVAWPAPVTLGWAVSKPLWVLGGSGGGGGGGGAKQTSSPSTVHADDARLAARPASPGLRLHLYLPAVHLSVVVTTVLVATHRWRAALLVLCGSLRWVPLRDA